MIRPFHAVAAMAENRVIGSNGSIPWHLPEDFKWFKQLTMGHVLIMGRKTFESIGRPLPGRETIVLSRSGFMYQGIKTVSSLEDLMAWDDRRIRFICGGAEIYRHALPLCSDLHLTLVAGRYEGDTHFPPFEHLFTDPAVERVTDSFRILHYRAPAKS